MAPGRLQPRQALRDPTGSLEVDERGSRGSDKEQGAEWAGGSGWRGAGAAAAVGRHTLPDASPTGAPWVPQLI